MPVPIHIQFHPPFNDASKRTTDRGFRNGHPPPAEELQNLVSEINTVATQRLKVPFCKTIRWPQCYNSVAAAETWRGQFHTGPNTTQIEVSHLVAPGEDDPVVTIDARMRWALEEVGVGTVNQTWLYHNDRRPNGTTAVFLDDMNEIIQTWSVSPDTTYRATLTQEDKLRVLSVTAHEVPPFVVATTDPGILDPTRYTELGQIYDSDAAAMQALVTTLYKLMGTHYISFCVDANVGQVVSGTTWRNLVDLSTTAYGTHTQGFICPTQYHGRMQTSADVTANLERIPVTCYAMMHGEGDSVELDFTDSTGTIATLSTTATTPTWVSSDVVWAASSLTDSNKVDIRLRNTNAIEDATCFAAGMYSYEAP